MKIIKQNTGKIQKRILTAISLMIVMSSMVLTSCNFLDDFRDHHPAYPSATSDELIPLSFFVRAENGAEIDPATTVSDTRLISDLGRKPVLAPDGHQVTWGEWSQVKGSISAKCTHGGTRVTLDLTGLIPYGVYTVWNVTFNAPGFTGEFDAPGLPANVKAFGPVGPNDGSRSVFHASASGKGSISVTTPPGPLGTVGEIKGCALTDELEWHVIGLYHTDGETHGSVRGPDGDQAEQFAFIFKKAE